MHTTPSQTDIVADLVVTNARVVSLSDDVHNASEIAVRGDTIIAVGGTGELDGYIGQETRVIDARGASVIPGINDAHLHLSFWAIEQEPFYLDTTGAHTLDALRERLRVRSADLPPNTGYRAGTWRDSQITEFAQGERTPHRSQLDDVTGDRPVVIDHFSHHAVWLNTAALERAGIDRATPDPEGGTIVRDDDGEATGVLLESATELAAKVIPPLQREERIQALLAGMRRLNAMGITSITDPVVTPQALRDYTEIHRRGLMSVRVSVLMHWQWPSLTSSLDDFRATLESSGLSVGLGDEWLRIGGVKLFADGVPGFKTAKVNEPYCGGGCGSLITAGHDDAERAEVLAQLVSEAHRHRINAQIHATGDGAGDAAIAAIVRAIENDPWPDARHAVIHGTLLSDEAYTQLAEHRIPVITSSIMKSWLANVMLPSIGQERWDRVFAAGSLHRAGVIVADSSDAPVVAPEWQRGIAAFVGAPFPELPTLVDSERITRTEALHGWTTAGAYLENAEQRKGQIAPGYIADIVILDQDFTTTPTDRLADIRPRYTLVGGQLLKYPQPAKEQKS